MILIFNCQMLAARDWPFDDLPLLSKAFPSPERKISHHFGAFYEIDPSLIKVKTLSNYKVGALFSQNSGVARLFTRNIKGDFGWKPIFPSFTENKKFTLLHRAINQETWNLVNENNNYTERHENSFVQAGKFFYIMGGRENSTTIDKYDFEADSWNALEDVAPLSFNHFQATEYQGYIWVIGAFQDNDYPNESPASHIWIFDPVNEQYIMGPEIPLERRRGSAGLVMYKGKFYVIGGNTDGHNGGYVPYFDEFDPATGTWTALTNAPHSRDHFHAAVIGNKLYAASGRLSGGDGGTFGPVIKEVDVYDFETQSWSTLPGNLDIPTGRAGAVVASFNDQLLIAGGEVPDKNDALAITEIFDPSTQTWSVGLDMNFPRHGTQGVVSGNGLFVASGSPKRGGGRQRNMEYFGTNNPMGQTLSRSSLSTAKNLIVNSESELVAELNVSGGNQAVFIKSMYLEGDDAPDFEFVNGEINNAILSANSSNPISLTYNGNKENPDAKLVLEYGNNNLLEIPIHGFVSGVIRNPPTGISHADQAVGIEKISELSWETEPLADEYWVQISLNENFSSTIANVQDISGTSFTTPELQDITTYYWRVAASNEEGVSPWSEVWSFTTLEAETVIPGTPMPVSPDNEET
ncbi:MAG: hypothetical protein WD431_00020, partial [Cyclobacteriaceae bacterium]